MDPVNRRTVRETNGICREGSSPDDRQGPSGRFQYSRGPGGEGLSGSFLRNGANFAGCLGERRVPRGRGRSVARPRARDQEYRSFRREDSFVVLSLDVRRCFSWLLRRNYRFDVIFADPPYESGLVAETLSLVGKNSAICSTDCLLIIERSVREPIVGVPPEGFVLSDERTYGESAVSFFRLRGNAS